METKFHLRREQANKLQCYSGTDPKCGFNFHSQIELCVVQEGEVEVWINDKHKVLKRGDISVALSYDSHRYQYVSESRVDFAMIPADMCPEFISAVNGRKPKSPFITDPAAFEKITECCKEIQHSENSIKIHGCVYVLLGVLLEVTELTDASEEADPSPTNRILFYINDNFKNDITLTSAASALGYNPSYLSRHFKSTFNISISRYITMVRLREAVMLMKKGNSVSYSAYESGFNSTRTFYRAFYNEFGCSPKEYLKVKK